MPRSARSRRSSACGPVRTRKTSTPSGRESGAERDDGASVAELVCEVDVRIASATEEMRAEAASLEARMAEAEANARAARLEVANCDSSLEAVVDAAEATLREATDSLALELRAAAGEENVLRGEVSAARRAERVARVELARQRAEARLGELDAQSVADGNDDDLNPPVLPAPVSEDADALISSLERLIASLAGRRAALNRAVLKTRGGVRASRVPATGNRA